MCVRDESFRRQRDESAYSPLGSVALLVLFPATAGAGIVTTDLVCLVLNGLRRRFVAPVEHHTGRRGRLGNGRGLLAADGLDAEHSLQHIRFDAVHHRGEHVETLAFVLDQRILLAVSAQADAVAQMVHAQ